MWVTERIVIAVTVLAVTSKPCSTWKGGHGDSSSFSAMQAAYFAGVPFGPATVGVLLDHLPDLGDVDDRQLSQG